MLSKIISLLLSFTLALGGLISLFVPGPGKPLNSEELLECGGFLNKYDCADEIYVVEKSHIPSEEKNTLICLQGLVNKESPRLYIIENNAYREYLNTFEDLGKKVIYTNDAGKSWTLKLLIQEFSGCIKDNGYTLYRNSEYAEGLNVCFNYATVNGWLAFPEELKNTAEECGLKLKLDLSNDEYDYSFQKKHYDALRDHFNKSAVVHVKADMFGLRDLAVQQGFWIGFTGSVSEGEKLLKYVLKNCGNNTAVLGWCTNEVRFVKLVSKMGCFVLPSDHSWNCSYISNFGFDGFRQKHGKAALHTDPSKHYLAIVASDGDNSQWIQNDFSRYYSKVSGNNDFPMTWTFSPAQQEISPASVNRAYSAGTENNYFIGGVSGFGYMNPLKYRISALDRFTEMTASALLRSDLSVFSILDEKPIGIMEPSFVKKLDYYTRFGFIKGGIALLDPDHYASGKGQVWFSNDKPVVSVRFSLWHPSNESKNVDSDWLRSQADIINEVCRADISSIDGYSVLNVHVWSITPDSLSEFVGYLDDDIELVTVDELLEMVSANCPHNTAVPVSAG